MSDILAKINLKEEFSTIDITNMSWSNYSDIMMALETMILLLKKDYNPEYSKSHKVLLIKRYELLFDTIKKGYPRYRGDLESLDDLILLKALNLIKI